jgi:hypothetical protein
LALRPRRLSYRRWANHSHRIFEFFDDAFQIFLLIIDIITFMRDIRADSKKQGEAKRRELVAELNRMDQGVIAKAVEGSIGCVLENGVLHLQYSQPSRHSGHAKVLRDPTLRAILDRAAKQVGAEILVF